MKKKKKVEEENDRTEVVAATEYAVSSRKLGLLPGVAYTRCK
jgi:hypothetical protein